MTLKTTRIGLDSLLMVAFPCKTVFAVDCILAQEVFHFVVKNLDFMVVPTRRNALFSEIVNGF